jgi:hypothetical protein
MGGKPIVTFHEQMEMSISYVEVNKGTVSKAGN